MAASIKEGWFKQSTRGYNPHYLAGEQPFSRLFTNLFANCNMISPVDKPRQVVFNSAQPKSCSGPVKL